MWHWNEKDQPLWIREKHLNWIFSKYLPHKKTHTHRASSSRCLSNRHYPTNIIFRRKWLISVFHANFLIHLQLFVSTYKTKFQLLFSRAMRFFFNINFYTSPQILSQISLALAYEPAKTPLYILWYQVVVFHIPWSESSTKAFISKLDEWKYPVHKSKIAQYILSGVVQFGVYEWWHSFLQRSSTSSLLSAIYQLREVHFHT